jgi:hypothetical protein
MKISNYPRFYKELKHYPKNTRSSYILYTLEKLGYQTSIIPIFYENGNELYFVEVKRGEKVLFNDGSQKFSFKKASELRQIIALEDYESYMF